MTNYFKLIKNTVKHWYLPLIVGILFVGFGLYMFSTPAESYLTLLIVFSMLFIFSGLSDIIFSISNKNELEGWGWTFMSGVFNFIIGAILLNHPEISIVLLPVFVGFTVLFKSITAISLSLELKKYGVLDWGNLMGIGVLGVIFSIILLWNPMFAGLSVVVWTALAFITFGIFNIYFSVKLKKLKDFPNKVPEELKEKLGKIQSEIKNEIRK